jgi:hypothetical protein
LKIELLDSIDSGLLTAECPIFFRPSYLDIQPASFQFLIGHLHDTTIVLPFTTKDGQADSLKFSPFGGVYANHPIDKDCALQFFESSFKKLIETGISTLRMVPAPELYNASITASTLIEAGFRITHVDTNQHLDLSQKVNYHQMELRKLRKLLKQDARVEKINLSEYGKMHRYISDARREQGLEINIDLDRMKTLAERHPDRYEAWAVILEGEWAACALMVKTLPNVVYYYLPATPAKWRSESPMVLLIDFMKNHYRALDYDFIDLGVSSVDGKLQNSLHQFKSRMGGIDTDRPTYLIEF